MPLTTESFSAKHSVLFAKGAPALGLIYMVGISTVSGSRKTYCAVPSVSLLGSSTGTVYSFGWQQLAMNNDTAAEFKEFKRA